MPSLLIANLKLIVRDRQTLFWALVFPLIFVVVFGLVDFDGGGSVPGAVFDRAQTPLSQGLRAQLEALEFFELDEELATEEEALAALENGDLYFVLVLPEELREVAPGQPEVPLILVYDQTNTTLNQLIVGVLERFIDGVNIQVAGASRVIALDATGVRARELSYMDVVLMGLVGMGLMFNSIITVAVKLSMYREQSVLRRLLVTPLRVSRFFGSFILAHTALAVVQIGIIMAVSMLVFGAKVHGNLLWIFLVAGLGNLVFLNIGVMVAAYARSVAAASSLGNLVAFPMMFFSGTFFPTESLPGFLPELTKVLPLTPLLEVLREISVDGGVPWNQPAALGMLAGWLAVSSVVATRLFKFR